MSKISKAVRGLITKAPFYGFFHLGLQVIIDEKFKSYGAVGYNKTTDKIMIIYNEKMLETLSDDEAIGLCAHEIMHITNSHIFMEDQYPNHELGNIAQDMYINSTLTRDEFKLPKDGLFPEKYATKNYPFGLPVCKPSMWYYNELTEENENIKQKNKSDGSGEGEGEGEDCDSGSGKGEPKSFDEMTMQERTESLLDSINNHNSSAKHNWDRDISGLSDIQKEVMKSSIDSTIVATVENLGSDDRGNIPAHIKSLLEKLKNITIPAENWKKLLKKQLGAYPTRNKKITRKKPSKRFSSSPGVKKQRVNKVLILIDTSGSMSDVDVAEAFLEVQHVYKAGGKIDVGQIDTQMNSVEEYSGKLPEYRYGGGGKSNLCLPV